MAKLFADQPNRTRNFIRDLVSTCGGDIVGYHGEGFSVAMPREGAHHIQCILAKAGWDVATDHLFPLGSDSPPESMRHNGPYQRPGDAAAYWRFVNFQPKRATGNGA